MAQVKDKVEYIIALINEFAKRFRLTDVRHIVMLPIIKVSI